MAVRLVLQVNTDVSISMTSPDSDENIINAVAIIVADLHKVGIQFFVEHGHIQSDEIGAVSLFGNTSVEIVMILLRAIIDEIVAGSQWPHIHGDKDELLAIVCLERVDKTGPGPRLTIEAVIVHPRERAIWLSQVNLVPPWGFCRREAAFAPAWLRFGLGLGLGLVTL